MTRWATKAAKKRYGNVGAWQREEWEERVLFYSTVFYSFGRPIPACLWPSRDERRKGKLGARRGGGQGREGRSGNAFASQLARPMAARELRLNAKRSQMSFIRYKLCKWTLSNTFVNIKVSYWTKKTKERFWGSTSIDSLLAANPIHSLLRFQPKNVDVSSGPSLIHLFSHPSSEHVFPFSESLGAFPFFLQLFWWFILCSEKVTKTPLGS